MLRFKWSCTLEHAMYPSCLVQTHKVPVGTNRHAKPSQMHNGPLGLVAKAPSLPVLLYFDMVYAENKPGQFSLVGFKRDVKWFCVKSSDTDADGKKKKKKKPYASSPEAKQCFMEGLWQNIDIWRAGHESRLFRLIPLVIRLVEGVLFTDVVPTSSSINASKPLNIC